jgi:hypothetical protein
MAAVKRQIRGEWNPVQENYQNVAELRSLAFRRLLAAVVSPVRSQEICQLTLHPFQANHIDFNLTPPSSPPHDF